MDTTRTPLPGLQRRAFFGSVSHFTHFLIMLNVNLGGTLFMPDYGSARCDFPGGDARTLYQSVRKRVKYHLKQP